MSARHRTWYLIAATMIFTNPTVSAAASIDQLIDLTGKVHVNVTLKGRDNFTSEYRYDVSVRNISPDLISADSLIIILDKISNLAGEDREGLTGESFLKRFDVLDQDGYTEDGKPFFHIPAGTSSDLVPQTDSLPAIVRLRNRDYVAVFTPSFRVLGKKHLPQDVKRAEASATTASPTPGSSSAANRHAIDKLIQLLIKKGVLTEEEWRKANQP